MPCRHVTETRTACCRAQSQALTFQASNVLHLGMVDRHGLAACRTGAGEMGRCRMQNIISLPVLA